MLISKSRKFLIISSRQPTWYLSAAGPIFNWMVELHCNCSESSVCSDHVRWRVKQTFEPVISPVRGKRKVKYYLSAYWCHQGLFSVSSLSFLLLSASSSASLFLFSSSSLSLARLSSSCFSLCRRSRSSLSAWVSGLRPELGVLWESFNKKMYLLI